mmetsp:Transcript_21280/g.42284  ORF Transcript_21280/g.42284 Transcript_21280/m.42284 type:complete len:218 (-) Transcript_21280:913-1566(-)
MLDKNLPVILQGLPEFDYTGVRRQSLIPQPWYRYQRVRARDSGDCSSCKHPLNFHLPRPSSHLLNDRRQKQTLLPPPHVKPRTNLASKRGISLCLPFRFYLNFSSINLLNPPRNHSRDRLCLFRRRPKSSSDYFMEGEGDRQTDRLAFSHQSFTKAPFGPTLQWLSQGFGQHIHAHSKGRLSTSAHRVGTSGRSRSGPSYHTAVGGSTEEDEIQKTC